MGRPTIAALQERITALETELREGRPARRRARDGRPLGNLASTHALVSADKTTGAITTDATITAAKTLVADAGGLLAANDVEAALAEIIGLTSTVILSAGACVLTSGNASVGTIQNSACWLFDAAAGETIAGYVRLPWTNFKYQVVWAPSDTQAGDVVWEVTRNSMSAGAVPAGTAVQGTSTSPGVTNQLVYTALSSSFPVPAGSLTGIRVTRRASDAADTYPVDAKFAAVVFTRA